MDVSWSFNYLDYLVIPLTFKMFNVTIFLEAERQLRLKFNFNFVFKTGDKMKKLIISLILVSFCVSSSFAQERITLTTYYPAPYGVYQEMRADGLAVGSTYRYTPANLTNGYLIVSGRIGVGTDTPGFPLDLAVTSETAIEFDNGEAIISIHDGFGNFNIKAGVDDDNRIVGVAGGSHIRMDDAGRIDLMIDESTGVGGAFSSPTYVRLDGGQISLTSSVIVVNGELRNSGWYGRTAHNSGGLVGSYNNVGANSSYSNPIYAIGSNYYPAVSTLSNFYGIGYTHTNASFIRDSGPNSWGMYVAADGDARVFLAASAGGRSYFNTTGGLGIGTDSPLSTLDVRGTSNICFRVNWTSTSASRECPSGSHIATGSLFSGAVASSGSFVCCRVCANYDNNFNGICDD